MPAYVIVDINVTDPEGYSQYKELAPASIAAYDGKYLARGGKTEVLEGNWSPTRLVILQFPTVDRAKQWLDSVEYSAARALRQKTAKSNMVVIQGL